MITTTDHIEQPRPVAPGSWADTVLPSQGYAEVAHSLSADAAHDLAEKLRGKGAMIRLTHRDGRTVWRVWRKGTDVA